MTGGGYQVTIGLEVHVQLSTRTKAFCGCMVGFGARPNSDVCPVCSGHPGTLPVLNRKVLERAILVALAFGCRIQQVVKFDRKSYFYPDLPKNYQISQFDMPLGYGGHVPLSGGRSIGIARIHIEEDAGKLIHDEGSLYSFVDLNRAGTPLLEIVSEPEIAGSDEAYSYLTGLKRTLKYLDVSDCNMEQGSLRCDANISLKKAGSDKLGTKTEIKNLNSFKAVREALEYEAARQLEVLSSGGQVECQTRLWDEKDNVTRPMRSKEEAHDYRYFPEPDLVPFEVPGELIDAVSEQLVELPDDRAERFKRDYEIDEKDVEVLVSEKGIADFFERTVRDGLAPKSVANWVQGEIMRHMNEKACTIDQLPITPEQLGRIIEMVDSAVISGLSGKEVLAECMATCKSPDEVVKERSLEQVSGEDELISVIDEVIGENQKPVNDLKGGKDNALSFLVGQVMRKTKGKANPKVAGELFRKRIGV